MIDCTVMKIEKKSVSKTIQCTFVFMMVVLVSACVSTTSQSNISVKNSNSRRNVISAYELHKILTDHFGFVSIKLSDAQYRLPDNAKLNHLRNSDYCKPSDKIVKDNWGNDDYAIAAMVPMRNYAFGIMYVSGVDGTKQVMNVLVNTHKKVVYWDPRACQYYQGQFDKPDFILF